MEIRIARLLKEIKNCYPLIVQLRTNLSQQQFLNQVKRQQKKGYALVYLSDMGQIVSVAGFRIMESLYYGKFIYVDDIITDASNRSKGYGDRLFEWLIEHAKTLGCNGIQLDSGVQRADAHRFYFKKRMNINAFHFNLPLDN